MFNQCKTVCFSGHRPEKLPKGAHELEHLRSNLYEAVETAIADGFDTFIAGGARGFDLMCAEVIASRKQIVKPTDPPQIRLISAIPYEEQAINWSEIERERYYDMMAKSDEVITLSTHYHSRVFYDRNQYMVDNAARLICYYSGGRSGTGHTVKYAQRKQLEIINLFCLQNFK